MSVHVDDSEYAQRRYSDLRQEPTWKRVFARHPDIPDHEANRKAIYDFAFSLSDGTTITFANLDEAAKTHPSLHRQDRHFATAENAKQDEQTLRTFCRDHRVQFHFAALNMLRNLYGGGFKPIAIDQALQSGKISFVPASDEDIARWDYDDAQELLEEIIGARIITQQDRLKFESMSLEQLRLEVARIREERRLQSLTGQELRAHIRSQQVDRTEKLPDDYTKAQLELMLATDDTGKIFKEGRNAFKDLCKRYGWRQVEERMSGYTQPAIAGVVRTLRHEFDTERI
jgi:hypothetical protein